MKIFQNRKIGLVVCGLWLAAFGLTGCLPEEPKAREFRVLDKTFVLPADYKYGGLWRKEIPILKFMLDIETYENIGRADKSNKPRRLEIQILPLHPNPEKTKAHYWTEKDPVITRAKPYACNEYDPKKMICKYDEENIVSFTDAGFFIRDKKTNEYLSVYGCAYDSTLPNPFCRGRSRLLNNLQIWYQYPIKYSDRVHELNEKIHAHVLSLYKPSDKNPEIPEAGGVP